MITSTHNPRIQWVRKLQDQPGVRRESGAFVVEGVRLVEEALQAGWTPQAVFYTEDLHPRGQALLAHCLQAGVALDLVSPQVMKSTSDTQAPQGLLTVMPLALLPLPAQPDFLLVLDNLRDPGNLGTILRTAAAAGVQGVLLTPGSTDPYGPKVVRAAMGAHFRLPVQSLDWEALRIFLRARQEHSLRAYLADVNQGISYTHADFRRPLALIIGSEAEGAGDAASSLADERVHIPMPGGSESLNAAVAAAVLMFEVNRQRSS